MFITLLLRVCQLPTSPQITGYLSSIPGVPPITTNRYSVALQHARDMSVRDKIEAEVRFSRELERVLGGAE